jgi:uncharacterized membrane protein YdjX (TVP38/TMEM64 family)
MSGKAEQSRQQNRPASHRDDGRPVSTTKIAIGILLVAALAGGYWWLWQSGALDWIADKQALRGYIQRFGIWGPLAMIALMAGAIVLSPIPSGPIAMVAGASFGPLLGTVYTVIGAEAGAVMAFWIARWLGFEAVRNWTRAAPLVERLRRSRSQNWLMAIVFASRLVPFISFDAVSYAAGLTPLAFWRFAVATLAGVIPVSFALAYFGEELITAEPGRMIVIALVVGGITLVPIGLKLLWGRFRKS